MPRHNRDDYEGDDIRDDYRDGPRTRKGGNTGLIVGLVVRALAVGLLIVCGGGVLLYTLGAKAGVQARQAQVVAVGGPPPTVDEQPGQPDMGALKGIPPEGVKAPATPKKDKPVSTFSRVRTLKPRCGESLATRSPPRSARPTRLGKGCRVRTNHAARWAGHR